MRDRLFLLEELKTQSQLFLNDPQTYDQTVVSKIQKHNPKKIVDQFTNLVINETPMNEWKSKIQEWNEKEQLPFMIMVDNLFLNSI